MDILETDRQAHSQALEALAGGRHGDPFSILGMHRVGTGERVVRCLQPGAAGVLLVDIDGTVLAPMRKLHAQGIFSALVPARKRRYLLRVEFEDGSSLDLEDPYRFPTLLSELNLGPGGKDWGGLWKILGSHADTSLGVQGTRFAVWAPNASRVSVVGNFNAWDGRRHVMRLHPAQGVWEIFLPGLGQGELYKFEILDSKGRLLPLKADPFGHYFESPPGNASIAYESRYRWCDKSWMAQRSSVPALDQPISIYEVHLGSWRHAADEGGVSYRKLARELVDYVRDMGFTHVELMPVSEHPFGASWGYQPIGMFAPTCRFGDPDDFRYFVDRCHMAGIAVILDWVPAHFPSDPHGLARFDGTGLYEHEDPRKGEHPDWGTLVFNYGRDEVVNYLISCALYWIEEFHIDALRVDAVASMLYLDYSRKPGQWAPNKFGGNENLEAVAFLRKLNEALHAHGASSYAEESTAWPGVSRPTYSGGLGFTYKWNMGWMHDTLVYMKEDPVHRKYHHEKMTFGMIYAFSENFVLPLSHDEVVHGKGSLLNRMPGDDWQRFANLRAYYASMFCHPGKKLLFMGAELAQQREWSHDRELDWSLLKQPLHLGTQKLVRDLNRIYRDTPALHEIDFSPEGFEWIDSEDRDNSVFSWLRKARDGSFVVCVINFNPVIRSPYRVGVPAPGDYRELINTDATIYGGSGVGNLGGASAVAIPAHGRPASLELTLPPLAALIFEPLANKADA
ncbi:MAG: 1,4-alpha-glucan branching protein GlgB [Gammaproteobacteria bacterium]|jgi:1,4-alpha-glucan branching enzyme|nr:1,4-alpha-glucan branching protein GlgB [Gammaproteobacteria bacterium]